MSAKLDYDEERKRVETMVSSLSPRRHPRHNSHFLSPGHAPPVPASLLHYGSGSIAEQTIVSHQPGGNQKPVVTKADGLQYPKNPENGYVSRYPTTFRGCLGCGQLGHLFKDCSKNRDQEVRADYCQELWCHIPATRKKPATTRDDQASHRSNTDAPVMHVATQQFTSGPLGRGRGVNTASWMSSSSPPSESKAPANKNPWILPILVGINNTYVKSSTPMPIKIDNNLPCVDFELGHETGDNSIHLRMLVDSGAAMNSGNKSYHR